ncbi:MAG: hypothetical protein J7K58_01915 [Euryarchaeota archaeon]|nr:hypothetical protein [Euryarchaeota archaeon]
MRVRSLGAYFGLFFIGGIIGAVIYNERVGNANSIPGLIVSVLLGLSFLLLFSGFTRVSERIQFKVPGFYDIIKILVGIFILSLCLAILKILPPSWATYIMLGSMLSLGIFMIAFGPYAAARRMRK